MFFSICIGGVFLISGLLCGDQRQNPLATLPKIQMGGVWAQTQGKTWAAGADRWRSRSSPRLRSFSANSMDSVDAALLSGPETGSVDTAILVRLDWSGWEREGGSTLLPSLNPCWVSPPRGCPAPMNLPVVYCRRSHTLRVHFCAGRDGTGLRSCERAQAGDQGPRPRTDRPE